MELDFSAVCSGEDADLCHCQAKALYKFVGEGGNVGEGNGMGGCVSGGKRKFFVMFLYGIHL